MNTKIYGTLLPVCFLLFVCAHVGLGEVEQEFYIAPSALFEDNINVDPEYTEFASDESDMGFSLEAGYEITPFISGDNRVGFTVDGAMTSYTEEDDFNSSALGLGAFYSRDMDIFLFHVDYSYDHTGVDGDPYVYSHTLYPSLFWKQSEEMTGLFAFRFKQIQYYETDLLDGLDTGFEFKEIWQINDMHEAAAGVFLHDGSFDADEYSYFGWQASVEYTGRLLRKQLEVKGLLSFGNNGFKDDFPGQGEARNENFYDIAVSMHYSFGRAGTVFAGVTYENNMSNVEVFEQDLSVVQAGYMFSMEF